MQELGQQIARGRDRDAFEYLANVAACSADVIAATTSNSSRLAQDFWAKRDARIFWDMDVRRGKLTGTVYPLAAARTAPTRQTRQRGPLCVSVGLTIRDPVALNHFAPIGQIFLGFQNTAIAHDHSRRCDILFAASDENTRQAQPGRALK